MSVRNKCIIKTYLTSNCCVLLKYKSSIHNIAFSSEQAILSESEEKHAQIKQFKQTLLNKSVGDFDVRGRKGMNFIARRGLMEVKTS